MFSLDVQKFAEGFSEGAEKAVRGTSIALFAAIIEETPFKDGRARANWFTTGQSPSTRITQNVDKSPKGLETKRKSEAVIVGIKDWSRFTITNNLPYIETLEFGGYGDGPETINGFSKQAPNGMVRTNIMRFNRLLDQQARKELPK